MLSTVIFDLNGFLTDTDFNNRKSFSAVLIMDRKKGDMGTRVKLIAGPSPYCDVPLHT